MFKLIYAKSVQKDLQKIASHQLAAIKVGLEELRQQEIYILKIGHRRDVY